MSGPVAGTGEVGADVQHQVGAAFQGPVVRELARGRQVGGVALRSACLGPGGERGDVLRRERPIMLELRADVGLGLPRRHGAVFDHGREVVGPLPGLLVGVQGERSHLALAMTFLAVLLEDPDNLLGVGRDGLRRLQAPGAGNPPPGREPTFTSSPLRRAAIASWSSLPAGFAFRTPRLANWSSMRPW